MAGKHFFFRLIPPRPTFAQDMNDEERAMMGQHAQYLRAAFAQGSVLIFGPVGDPAGSYGMAVLQMPDLAAAEQFAANDPTVLAGLNTYAVMPMMVGGAQASRD